MKHPKNVGEYTDMKKLADDISDLDYDTLLELIGQLSIKVTEDGHDGMNISKEHYKIGWHLRNVGTILGDAYERMKQVSHFSKEK